MTIIKKQIYKILSSPKLLNKYWSTSSTLLIEGKSYSPFSLNTINFEFGFYF